MGFHISHVYFLWQDLSVYTKIFDFVTLTLTFDLLLKKLNLGNNFWPKRDRDFTWVFLVAKRFCWKQIVLPRDLDLEKKLNLDHNFWTKSDRALIYISIPCDKTFLLIPIFWPSGLDLDFWPTFGKKKRELVAAGGISPVRTEPDLVWWHTHMTTAVAGYQLVIQSTPFVFLFSQLCDFLYAFHPTKLSIVISCLALFLLYCLHKWNKAPLMNIVYRQPKL